MLYILAAVLGAAIGFVSGGKTKNIFEFKLEKSWLILSAFVIQIAFRVMCYNGFELFKHCSFVIHGFIFLMLLVAAWFNRHYLGVLLTGIGCFLNALVIEVNGGRMPVTFNAIMQSNIPQDAVEVIKNGIDGRYVLVDEGTRLVFLGDIIQPPSILSVLMQIVSIGDLIIAAGMLVLVFEVVAGRRLGDKIAELFGIKRKEI